MSLLIIIYVIICCITSTILLYDKWLGSRRNYEISDYIITGAASLLGFIILPLLILGLIGKEINSLIKKIE